jgi:hypothetical protein
MSIPTIWAPVIAALGSASLTGAVAFGLEWGRSRRASKAALAERRARAYSSLISVAGVIAHTAAGLHAAMAVRSGIGESVDVLMGKRRLLEPLELINFLRADTEPLYRAWADVWTIGSPLAIGPANDVVDKCASVMGAATTRGVGATRLVRTLVGEKWTRAQLDEWQMEVRALADARRRLAEVARAELGIEVAELFVST